MSKLRNGYLASNFYYFQTPVKGSTRRSFFLSLPSIPFRLFCVTKLSTPETRPRHPQHSAAITCQRELAKSKDGYFVKRFLKSVAGWSLAGLRPLLAECNPGTPTQQKNKGDGRHYPKRWSIPRPHSLATTNCSLRYQRHLWARKGQPAKAKAVWQKTVPICGPPSCY